MGYNSASRTESTGLSRRGNRGLGHDGADDAWRSTMKRLVVVHPILFALFFVLALYSYNVAEVSPSEIVLPISIVLGSTLLLLLLSRLLFRDIRKAGLVVSIFLVLFFSYGHVSGVVENWGITYKVLVPIWALLIVGGGFWTVHTRRGLRKLTRVLNVMAIALVIVPSINITVNEARAASSDPVAAEDTHNGEFHVGETDGLPDIYYIVMDRYASAGTLEEFYDFDNSEFLDYLSDKGFYVAGASKANYLKTHLALASSLNMKYINYLGDELGKDFTDLGRTYQMVEDYEVWRFLKAQGYKFMHFGTDWEPTRKNDYADININRGDTPEFSRTLLRTTMLYPLALDTPQITLWLDGLPSWLKAPFVGGFRQGKWDRILYKFDQLADVPHTKGPTFVFAHMLITHPPFVFDEDGGYRSEEEAEGKTREVNYVDQVLFANDKLTSLIDRLISDSDVPPIIVLQADEGPFPVRYAIDEFGFRWDEATDAELREKMGILNAIYLPDGDTSVLYPSISPVNTFRVIFNRYFSADLELLPDRSYAFASQRYQYDLFDITDKLTPN